ncbi:mevalonate kinase-like [Formica exsecta]|uniref:mevalonate kinase-like n=1 Tax=Formica exsecta TaxID=72781 RepID=UPI001143533C|nr:mevalonate kinase-like [Formica exsecta]XP_029664261.1 mevalonate kinase-like [Formica exsecta]XP_029664262.1 mevalonate kinase-like [Formica exsecta]
MIQFQISAPGSIILSGEHAMLYGKRSVVAGLDRRTTLKFAELIDDPRNIIKIEFPDVDISLNLSWQLVQHLSSNNNLTYLNMNKILLLKHVEYFITLNGMWKTYPQRFSLQTFFFLLLFIAHHEGLDIKPFHVHLTTQLVIGAGLGSSTSFAVCLVACFLHWARLQRGTHDAFEFNELTIISRYVSWYEKIIQEYMFGVDSGACSFGNINVRFLGKNGIYFENYVMPMPRMKILLIDSRIHQNKHEQMKQIAELKYSHSKFVNLILEKIDKTSKQFCEKLGEIKINYINGNSLELENSFIALQIVVQVNQSLLSKLNMSYPELDIICSIARECGFAGKLTGFGRFVYILLSPDIPEVLIENLSTHLMAEGFDSTITSMSCNGVSIHDYNDQL